MRTVHCASVYGLPANLVYGGMLGRGVNAAAFSSTAGLVSRVGQIEYLAVGGSRIGAYSTDEPSPLLAAGSAGTGTQTASEVALAWLPSSQLLLSWFGGTANQVQIPHLPGSVISLAFASAGFADLMVVLGDGMRGAFDGVACNRANCRNIGGAGSERRRLRAKRLLAAPRRRRPAGPVSRWAPANARNQEQLPFALKPYQTSGCICSPQMLALRSDLTGCCISTTRLKATRLSNSLNYLPHP